ncbi:hypothetical protein H0H87_010629 [Tephrocybe sp. NHM501043]|nr:hypothetical protein H0H87_010629 [Tephrocybe sp. NHM501043]
MGLIAAPRYVKGPEVSRIVAGGQTFRIPTSFTKDSICADVLLRRIYKCRRAGPLTRFPKSPAMQTQCYPHPFHPQGPYHSQASYLGQTPSNNFVSPTGLDLSGFSRGSSLSYPHQEYQHPTDRGGPAWLAEPSSSLSSNSLCATRLGFSEHSYSVSPNDCIQAEEITEVTLQQHWQWMSGPEPLHGLPLAAVPRAPPVQHAQHVFPQIKRNPVDFVIEPSAVLSPAAQRPTPASMAILLNQTLHSDANSPQASFHQPSESSCSVQAPPIPAPHLSPVSQTLELEVPATPSDDLLSRERKHACTMCHKRWANLHVRRCILKPVNAAGKQSPPTGGSSRSQEPSSPSSSNIMSPASSDHNNNSPGRPARATPTSSRQTRPAGVPKRRRRAPSPSRWVPPSLLDFNLTPPESKKCTPVPLPPVHRSLPREERDSWDENVSSTPYHPRGWKNILPGPGLGLGLGLGGKDVRNLNLGGNGGFMLGRVFVLDLNTDEKR